MQGLRIRVIRSSVSAPQMTRPKNEDSLLNEARLQEAIAAVLDGKHTCYSLRCPRQYFL